jgi:hypothetical protein
VSKTVQGHIVENCRKGHRRQAGRQMTPIHMGNYLFIFNFAFGSKGTNRVKFGVEQVREANLGSEQGCIEGQRL